MKITCPHCGLVGKIGEDKLSASSGTVRCPRCHKTFTPVDEEAPSGRRAGTAGEKSILLLYPAGDGMNDL